jgi:hypothetical protein
VAEKAPAKQIGEQFALLGNRPTAAAPAKPPIARAAPKPLEGFIIQLAFNDKEWAAAGGEFEKAWQKDPASYPAAYNLMLAQLSQGQKDQCVELIPRMLPLVPSEAERERVTQLAERRYGSHPWRDVREIVRREQRRGCSTGRIKRRLAHHCRECLAIGVGHPVVRLRPCLSLGFPED